MQLVLQGRDSKPRCRAGGDKERPRNEEHMSAQDNIQRSSGPSRTSREWV